MNHRIISRAEAGLRPPRRPLTPVTWPAGGPLHVHHSAGPTPAVGATLRQDAATVRGIQVFHQYTRGWIDVGYGYLLLPSGRIFEGRGRHHGAHSPPVNDEASACIVGTYTDTPPSDQALSALAWLRDHLDAGALRGHRDSYATSCPGDAGYAAIKALADRVPSAPDPAWPPPHGGSLRLQLPGHPLFAGWGECIGPMRNIARNGLEVQACAISWRGHTWRGPKDVTNVTRRLLADHT